MGVPRIRLSQSEHDMILANRGVTNTMIIGDIHAPFTLKGYLEFCIEMAKKWNITDVIFSGDIVDNHYSSFHNTDPDGRSAKDELDRAREVVQQFYKAFPIATVLTGNHDNIPSRKAFANDISDEWIRPINEVLGVPNWTFKEYHWVGNILFCHGIGRKAISRMKQDMVSVVQGHYHSESYIRYQVGRDRKTFAMQVGCGVDKNTYAVAYGKHFMKQHINVGILLNNEVPILEYMNLEE